MNFTESIVGDIVIDLSGGDGGMAEHGLDAPDVSAIDQEVSGVAVTESVRCNFFDNAGGASMLGNETLDTAGS